MSCSKLESIKKSDFHCSHCGEIIEDFRLKSAEDCPHCSRKIFCLGWRKDGTARCSCCKNYTHRAFKFCENCGTPRSFVNKIGIPKASWDETQERVEVESVGNGNEMDEDAALEALVATIPDETAVTTKRKRIEEKLVPATGPQILQIAANVTGSEDSCNNAGELQWNGGVILEPSIDWEITGREHYYLKRGPAELTPEDIAYEEELLKCALKQ